MENLDLVNIAHDLCDGFIYKTANKKQGLSKDELLTYNSSLRMLKAIMDNVSDGYYLKQPKNPLDDEQGAPVAG